MAVPHLHHPGPRPALQGVRSVHLDGEVTLQSRGVTCSVTINTLAPFCQLPCQSSVSQLSQVSHLTLSAVRYCGHLVSPLTACPPRTTTCPRQPPPPPAPAARTRGPSIESSGHQDPPQEVENFHTDFTITEKASTEAFYVIMNFQTSQRFVSSSNPLRAPPALILRTLFSP